VNVDPATVHSEREPLDRPPAPANDTPGLGFVQILVTDVGDRQGGRCLGLVLLLGINARRNHDKLLKGKLTRFLDRHQAVAADDGPLVASGERPLLDDKVFQNPSASPAHRSL